MAFALSPLTLSSTAFASGAAIPRRHSSEGDNLSPALQWTEVPDGTKSFALICHDPDAPLAQPGSCGFVHWVLYNLPGDLTELPEGAAIGTAGQNNFGKTAYGGPMPPPGHGTHHYFFVLMALNQAPGLAPGLSLGQLMAQIEPHVIGMNRLMGTYQR